MAETTAIKLGLDDHWRYLHVTDGKANYSPPASAGKWFKLVSVGATAHDAGVGAVEAWEYPALADGISTHNIVRTLEALSDGTGRYDTQSPAWAGKRVLGTLGLDPSQKPKAKALLAAWVKERWLTLENRMDEHRKPRDYYVVTGRPESGFEVESDGDSSDLEGAE